MKPEPTLARRLFPLVLLAVLAFVLAKLGVTGGTAKPPTPRTIAVGK
jgi:hypothetical protein